MEELKQLILAWGEGADCWCAIHDILDEMGCSALAEYHAKCKSHQCDLYWVVQNQFRKDRVHLEDMVEHYRNTGDLPILGWSHEEDKCKIVNPGKVNNV